jgi:XRE family transcriptional regulator
MNFGEYLEEKRISRNYTLRQFAKKIDISFTYLADVEKGRSKAFKLEILNKIIEVLQLDEKETDMLYDLAGKSRNTIAPDIEEYLKENKELIEEIRMIKRKEINDETK